MQTANWLLSHFALAFAIAVVVLPVALFVQSFLTRIITPRRQQARYDSVYSWPVLRPTSNDNDEQ